MNLYRLSSFSIAASLAGILLLMVLSVDSGRRILNSQDAIAEILELRARINDFSAASDNLVLFGADPGLWEAYLAEGTVLMRELEQLGERHADARKAAWRVSQLLQSVDSALGSSDPDRDPARLGPGIEPLDVPARSRILLHHVAGQGIALDAALDTALRQRQQAIAREAAWIGVTLAGAALLFGALCVVAFGLIHRRVARPARAIEDTLERLRQGETGARAPVTGKDELGRLAEKLNKTLDERDAADAQLVERQAKLQAALESLADTRDRLVRAQAIANIGSWELDLANERLEWSDQVFKIFGLGREDYDGRLESLFERVHSEDREWLRHDVISWMERGGELDVAHRIVRPDGEVRWVRAQAQIIPGPDGRPASTSGTVQDITDMRRAEAEVARQGRLLDMAGRAARFGAWSADLESHRIEWSDVVAEIHAMPHGYSPSIEEGIGFYAPECRDRIRMLFAECAEQGQAFDEELQIIDANGQRRWVRAVGEAVRDARGNIVRVQGAFEDISPRKELEAETKRLADRLATMLESITDGFVAFDHQWRYTYVNVEAQRLLGKSADQLYGSDLWTEFPDVVGTRTEDALRYTMQERETSSAEEYFGPLDTWFDNHVYPWEQGVAVFFRDVTENRRMLEQVQAQEAALRASSEELSDALNTRQALINSLPAHIAMLDENGVIVDVNEQWRHFGEQNAFSGSDFGIGTNYISLCETARGECSEEAAIVADGLRDVLSARKDIFALEYPCHSPDEQRWFRVMFNRLSSDEAVPTGAVAMHIDITERKRAEQEITRLAYEDPLTGILSRNGFVRSLNERLEQGGWPDQGAVAVVDVVNQHDINDAHGYDRGDRLLTGLGRRLQELVGDRGLAGRTGGDEFAVYCALSDTDSPNAFLDRLEHCVDEAFHLDDGDLVIKLALRIGYTALGKDRRNAQNLTREAELALFELRKRGVAGESRIPFTHDINERTRQRIQLTGELGRALDQDEFELHFQPQVDLSDGSLISGEALIRWRHPERGLLAPGLFIPVAEQSQLIGPIGDWVLRAACRQLHEWRRENVGGIRVAVNVSQVQFMLGDFSAKVRSALEEFDVAPEHLSLEITESVFERHSERLLAEIHRLHELGVRLSLDDFGTGYSSLLYLQRYPFDEVKIDRGFVSRLLDDKYSRDIVLAVMDLAHALDAEVVAEGIESKEISGALLAMGCKVGQGFYYSMPLESEDFRWLLQQRSKLPLGA
ncbi:MAG: EAL domain-containing protein [Wenzhouxiangellaceae bacterium]